MKFQSNGTRPLLILNVVGLTRSLIGEHTPFLKGLLESGEHLDIMPTLPAVTCTVQSSMLTGSKPEAHGIVANGWYHRELSEIHFWKQSNHIVKGEMIWDTAKKINAQVKCAQLFWWFNMYSSADFSVTPRPIYRSDGRKIPDVYSKPSELAKELSEELGTFPLFKFWGPMADITSTKWIANATKIVHIKHKPELHFVYLPHLDYNLQRIGPNHPAIQEDLKAVDTIVEDLWSMAEADHVTPVVISEYGIEEVDTPIHINRELRRAGFIRVRDEQGHESLDAGACDAFAVADHQIAHVYLNNKDRCAELKAFLASLQGIEEVLDQTELKKRGLLHERSGEFLLVAKSRCWFCYYFWLDDRRAPDYARTVNIHAKPGYDPAELFLDQELRFPKLSVAKRIAQQKAGIRGLMDVIGLEASVVKGSHGRIPSKPETGPMILARKLPDQFKDTGRPIPDFAIKELLLSLLFQPIPGPV